MKIDNDRYENVFAPKVDKPTKDPIAGADFNRMFDTALEQAAHGQEFGPKTISCASYSNVSAVLPIKTDTIDPNPVVDQVEDLLNKLDNYRSQLSDQNVLPNQVNPLVNSLITAKERLALKAYYLAEDSTLKEIADHAIEITDHEINNFKNGFLSSSYHLE